MDAALEDFPAFRQADVRWHIGLAEATGSAALVAAMTEAQGAMSDLIGHIAHPPELLAWTNRQHGRWSPRCASGDGDRAMRIMAEHLKGTRARARRPAALGLDFRLTPTRTFASAEGSGIIPFTRGEIGR